MKKLYEKSEMTLTLILIAVYVVGKSVALSIDRVIGIESSASVLFMLLLTAVLAMFIVKNGLQKKFGLCKMKVSARKFLWFVPLAIVVSSNLWLGTAQNLSGLDLACYLCSMLCVGFAEEILFRGMLFRAIEKSNHTKAVVISSITFGLGHIVNMINGVQSDWRVSICQIVYAIFIGLMFVTIFDRGGSLWPCVIAHITIDMLSAFANEARLLAKPQLRLVTLGSLIVMIGLYLLWLNHSLPQKAQQETKISV